MTDAFRTFDLAASEGRETYFLLTGMIIPRPIAWISTLAPDGTANIAPFSFTTVLSSDPPVVCFVSSGVKDSMLNAQETRRLRLQHRWRGSAGLSEHDRRRSASRRKRVRLGEAHADSVRCGQEPATGRSADLDGVQAARDHPFWRGQRQSGRRRGCAYPHRRAHLDQRPGRSGKTEARSAAFPAATTPRWARSSPSNARTGRT